MWAPWCERSTACASAPETREPLEAGCAPSTQGHSGRPTPTPALRRLVELGVGAGTVAWKELSLSQGTFNLDGSAIGRVSLKKGCALPPLPSCQWQGAPASPKS